MGCKHSKVVTVVKRRPRSPPDSHTLVKPMEILRQTSASPSVRAIEVQPCSRPSSPVPPRLARSISNTTFVIDTGSNSDQKCPSDSGSEDFHIDGGHGTADNFRGGSGETGEPSLVLDGRLTRTIIRQVEDYKRFDCINSDDISDVVETYHCSDDSDEDVEESGIAMSSSGSDSDPMLARGARTPEMVRKIRAFDNDVSSLLVAQSIPGCSTTDANVRPKAAKGVRVACAMDKEDQCNGLYDTLSLVACPKLSRPQLTVAGLRTTADDCLNSWMSRQQRKEKEGEQRADECELEENGLG